MAETIEAFVAKLQTEGVQAGKAEAEKILESARAEAETILADARAEAEKIVADANAEAESLLERSRTELDLAARDTLLTLREVLNRSLSAVLAKATGAQLKDPEFLKEVIRDVVMRYAEADLGGEARIELNLSDEMQRKLAEYVLSELRPAAEDKGLSVELRDALKAAGFEYEVTGATVEVTLDSLVETLRGMVAPHLRDVLDTATAPAADTPNQEETQG